MKSFTTTKKREAFVKILLTVVRYRNTECTALPMFKGTNYSHRTLPLIKLKLCPGNTHSPFPPTPDGLASKIPHGSGVYRSKLCVSEFPPFKLLSGMHCVGSPHLADRFLANGPPSCFHFLATVNDGRPCRCLLFILGSENLLLLTDLYGLGPACLFLLSVCDGQP